VLDSALSSPDLLSRTEAGHNVRRIGNDDAPSEGAR
jgi:hypothetical protein